MLFNLSHTHTHIYKHCILIHSNPLGYRRAALYKSKLKGWLIDSHTKEQDGFKKRWAEIGGGGEETEERG